MWFPTMADKMTKEGKGKRTTTEKTEKRTGNEKMRRELGKCAPLWLHVTSQCLCGSSEQFLGCEWARTEEQHEPKRSDGSRV